MGRVKVLLYSEPLAEASPAMYASKRSLEAAESLHHHERNIRLEYDEAEFRAMLAAMARAAKKRIPGLSTEANTVYLDLSDIATKPGMTPRRFEIEESTYPTLPETTIHVHYRNLRLEFTHREWEEFAKGVTRAWKRWHLAR